MRDWIRRHLVLASFLAALALYAVSAVGHRVPQVAELAVELAACAGLILGWRRPRWAVAAVALELVVGSFGREAAADLAGFNLSLREALLGGAVFAWTTRQLLLRRGVAWFPQPFSGPLRLLAVAVAVGIAFGPLGVGAFHDYNGYLFLLATPLIFANVRAGDWATYGKILAGGVAALATLTVATLLAFGWFPREQLDGLYTWIRDVRLGEITPVAGTYYRVFLQSQIYTLLLALGGAAAYLWRGSVWSRRAALAAAAVGTVATVASLSRSFWVAGVAGAAALGWMLWRSGRKLIQVIRYGLAGVVAVAVAFYGLQLATGNFPLSLQQRFDANEPAAAARSAQLDPLWSAIKDKPLWGSGFGATVTYRAVDPRRAAESAEVATDTFELGWLDSWLDIGLVGVFALLWWLQRLWRSGASTAGQSATGAVTAVAVLALAVVHIFTPYLNHPLGLGLLLYISALQPRTKQINA